MVMRLPVKCETVRAKYWRAWPSLLIVSLSCKSTIDSSVGREMQLKGRGLQCLVSRPCSFLSRVVVNIIIEITGGWNTRLEFADIAFLLGKAQGRPDRCGPCLYGLVALIF